MDHSCTTSLPDRSGPMNWLNLQEHQIPSHWMVKLVTSPLLISSKLLRKVICAKTFPLERSKWRTCPGKRGIIPTQKSSLNLILSMEITGSIGPSTDILRSCFSSQRHSTNREKTGRQLNTSTRCGNEPDWAQLRET